MLFNEKCGVCGEKIPDEENFCKVVFAEYCSSDLYDERAILFVCCGCFTDIFLGAHGVRKGMDQGKIEDET